MMRGFGSIATVIGLISIVVTSGVAFAAEPTVCDTPTTPLTGTFDSIVVPVGKECDLANATINGNISVHEGAILFLLGGVHVTGNISASDAEFVQVLILPPFATTPNVVDGNVSAIGTTGNPAQPGDAVNICGTIIGKDLRCQDNDAPFVIGGNTALRLIGQCGP